MCKHQLEALSISLLEKGVIKLLFIPVEVDFAPTEPAPVLLEFVDFL